MLTANGGRCNEKKEASDNTEKACSVFVSNQTKWTFSSDDEHVNVNYRKLENEP